jgi:hypothetical protein
MQWRWLFRTKWCATSKNGIALQSTSYRCSSASICGFHLHRWLGQRFRTQQEQTKETKQGSEGAQAPNGAPDFDRRSEAKPLFQRFVYLVSFCSN